MAGSRRPFKAFASRFSLRIRRGPLEGLRWIVASGIRFVEGRYDPPSVRAMAEAAGPGKVVFDVGAHVGYMTAVASLAVGPEGEVCAFEPLPLNLRYLRRHVALNELGNVRIVAAAGGDRTGTSGFDEGTGTGTGHLAEDGSLEVRTVVLDELVRSGEIPPPDVMKVDVEGAEARVLRGAMDILSTDRPTLLLSTHGPEAWGKSVKLLEEAGYGWAPVAPEKAPGFTELLCRPVDTRQK